MIPLLIITYIAGFFLTAIIISYAVRSTGTDSITDDRLAVGFASICWPVIFPFMILFGTVWAIGKAFLPRDNY